MEKLRFSHFGGTIKNEVVPTSAPHKIAGNYFSGKKKFLPIACFFHQKNFQTSMTSRSAGLRKNVRDPPPYLPVLESGSLLMALFTKNMNNVINISPNWKKNSPFFTFNNKQKILLFSHTFLTFHRVLEENNNRDNLDHLFFQNHLSFFF